MHSSEVLKIKNKSVDLVNHLYPTTYEILKLGQVAQSVEQGTENPCVGGSIPSLPSFFEPSPFCK